MIFNSSICDDGNSRKNGYVKTSTLTLISAFKSPLIDGCN